MNTMRFTESITFRARTKIEFYLWNVTHKSRAPFIFVTNKTYKCSTRRVDIYKMFHRK